MRDNRLIVALPVLLLSAAAVGCSHNQPVSSTPAGKPPVECDAPSTQPSLPPVAFVELTPENLESEVLGASGPVVVVVCHKDRGACKVEDAALRAVYAKFKDRVKFTHVEVSRETSLAVSLGARSGQDLPVHILVKDGEPILVYRGVLDEAELTKALDLLIEIRPDGAPLNTPAGSDPKTL